MGCKKIFALFLYLSYFLIAQAQKNKYAYGAYTSLFNSNEVMYKRLIGSSTQFKENHLFSVGVESTKQLTQKLYILGAVEYANHQYTVSFSNPNPFAVPVPDKRGEITLLTVPAQLRLNFWNYFFVSGGMLVDFK